MKNNKFIIFSVAVIGIIAIIGLFTPVKSLRFGSTTTNYPSLGTTRLEVGTNCGDSFSSSCVGVGTIINTYGTLTFSDALATTSTGSETLAATDLAYPTILDTPNLAALTITLPTATILGSTFLPNVGDRTSIAIYNATTTGAAIITLAGNTGTTLVSASTTKLILAGYVTTLEVIRTGASALLFRMTGN